MKKLNPDSVFQIFNQDDREIFQEAGMEHLMNEDYMLIGMAVKGIDNYEILDKINKEKLKELYLEIKDGVKYRYFCKMYDYLYRVKLNKLEDLFDFVQVLGVKDVYSSFEILLSYFREIEDYEKCLYLHDLQKRLLRFI